MQPGHFRRIVKPLKHWRGRKSPVLICFSAITMTNIAFYLLEMEEVYWLDISKGALSRYCFHWCRYMLAWWSRIRCEFKKQFDNSNVRTGLEHPCIHCKNTSVHLVCHAWRERNQEWKVVFELKKRSKIGRQGLFFDNKPDFAPENVANGADLPV